METGRPRASATPPASTTGRRDRERPALRAGGGAGVHVGGDRLEPDVLVARQQTVEVAFQLGHRLIATVAILRHRPHDDRLDRVGDPELGAQLRRRLRGVVQHLGDDPQVVVGAERHLAGQALVKEHAQRPDVGAMVQVLLAARLLGRHVERRSEQQAGVGQTIAGVPFVAARLDRLRDAEVDDLDEVGVAALDQVDVLGFDVAVEDPLGVRGAERAGDLAGDPQAALDRQRRLAHRQLGQRLAVEELHHDERAAVVGGAEVRHVDDVLVADGAREARLLQQARDEVALGVELLEQDLDRDALADDGVGRLVDRAHPALADPPDNLIPPGQHGPDERIESFSLFSHLRGPQSLPALPRPSKTPVPRSQVAHHGPCPLQGCSPSATA